ncbi:GNAT family N-acetyltransferase [Halorientalis marina]|uniref:GNAT family N-acetyltransferase n=1 Tax=Halorientalis marina TaxID=2931976 RepID=UPI001FF43F10|nr:GNAT family N-acetyltransferase [Halorientalis marina]
MTERSTTVHSSIESVNENQWNNLVKQAELGSVFHRYGWLETIERTLNLEPRHVVVSKGNNPIAVFPNFVRPLDLPVESTAIGRLPLTELVSIDPGYGGPAIVTDEGESLELLFEGLESIGGPSLVYHAVVANDLNYIRYGKFFEKNGYRQTSMGCRFEHHLARGWEAIRNEMHKERRRALREADDLGVETRVRDLSDGLDDLYRSYEANMARIEGGTFPKSFFVGIRDSLPGRLFVITASIDKRDIGSYVYVLNDERGAIHHLFSAIPDTDDFQYYPSEVLHANAINWGIDNDYHVYDFGGTGAAFDNSVFRHKKKFGGKTVPILRWQKGLSPITWRAFKLGRRVYQKWAY